MAIIAVYMALILSGLLAKICGRLCQEKLKSPNHWRLLKEIFGLSKRLVEAVNNAIMRPFDLKTFSSMKLEYFQD